MGWFSRDIVAAGFLEATLEPKIFTKRLSKEIEKLKTFNSIWGSKKHIVVVDRVR